MVKQKKRSKYIKVMIVGGWGFLPCRSLWTEVIGFYSSWKFICGHLNVKKFEKKIIRNKKREEDNIICLCIFKCGQT